MPERGQRKTNDPPNECRPSTKLSLPPRHSYLCNPRPHSLKWRHEALVWMRHVCGHLCERGRLAGVTACEGVACYPVGECECAKALSLSRRACSIMRTGASPRMGTETGLAKERFLAQRALVFFSWHVQDVHFRGWRDPWIFSDVDGDNFFVLKMHVGNGRANRGDG